MKGVALLLAAACMRMLGLAAAPAHAKKKPQHHHHSKNKSHANVTEVKVASQVPRVLVSSKTSQDLSAAPQAAPAGSPVTAPAPGPAGPAIPTVALKFEIENYNYLDLEQSVCTEEVDLLQTSMESKSSKDMPTIGAGPTPRTDSVLREQLSQVIGYLVNEALAGRLSAPAPVAAPSSSPASPASFLSANRKASPAASPAAPPAPAPSGIFAGSRVWVAFQPGAERVLANYANPTPGPCGNLNFANTGFSTLVTAYVFGAPGSGVDELPKIESFMKSQLKDWRLYGNISDTLYELTGFEADIRDMEVVKEDIHQWSENVCDGHFQKVLRNFEMTYTRRMVPTALFNECTNFGPALSFTRDEMLTKLDKFRCRKSVVKFAKMWNYGKGEKKGDNSAVPLDIKEFCHDVCEIKYGNGAPQCHVEAIAAQGP